MNKTWILAVAMMFGCAGLADAQQPKRPTPKVPAGVKALRDLAYVEDGHERNRLDLYLPEKAAGRLPLVVWIHGGGVAGRQQRGLPRHVA